MSFIYKFLNLFKSDTDTVKYIIRRRFSFRTLDTFRVPVQLQGSKEFYDILRQRLIKLTGDSDFGIIHVTEIGGREYYACLNRRNGDTYRAFK